MTKKVFSLMAAVVLMFSSVSMTSYDNDEELFDTCGDTGFALTLELIGEDVDVGDAWCIGGFFINVCRGGDALDAVDGLVDCLEND